MNVNGERYLCAHKSVEIIEWRDKPKLIRQMDGFCFLRMVETYHYHYLLLCAILMFNTYTYMYAACYTLDNNVIMHSFELNCCVALRKYQCIIIIY